VSEKNQGGQPAQQQPYPGSSGEMSPEPRDEMRGYTGIGLLAGKKALVTGGDSGIGRAVAVAFAKEGADVAVAYLSEHADAEHTAKLVEETGRRCLLLPGDLSIESACNSAVEQAVSDLNSIDILVNHLGTQTEIEDLEQISTEQWDHTFKVNVYSFFWVTRAALPHMPDGGAIVNTASVNGFRGNKSLIDYSATKAAVLGFSYALAQSLMPRRIRVNA
jgi:NAD(P)-dependent dehydrogenase (short-subunit alcohol dehydrogenase family)